MSNTDCFKNQVYKENEDTVLAPYIRQMTKHIKLKFPQLTEKEAEAAVRKMAKERFKDPQIKRVRFPSAGNSVIETVSLAGHTKQIKGLITSPSGNSYCLPSTKRSLLSETLAINVATRSKAKKKMLVARESGDVVTANKANGEQNARKVLNNAAAGGNKNPHNPFTDRSGFNAITSISRMSVRCGYGTVERMMSGNVYLPSYEDALSFIYRLIEIMPNNAQEVADKFKLNMVSEEVFTNWIKETISFYTNDKSFYSKLEDIIGRLTPLERTFVFCGGSLYHLFQLNSEFFKSWIERATKIEKVDPSIDPDMLGKIEGTVSIMVRSANVALLGKNDQGKPFTLDEAKEKNPEGIKEIVALAQQFESCMGEIAEVISTFVKVECEPPQLAHNARLMRKCVILCDTDSNIFTTEKMIRWFFDLPEGKIKFNKRAYEINAFSVLCVSKYLEHSFARLSTNIGMEGKSIYGISMKNEYLFPTFIRTYISKHYTALMEQQEGKQLPKMDLELKGVNFKGSMRTMEITRTLGKHMVETMNTIMETDGELSSYELLKFTADKEKEIIASLKKGEQEYLTMVNIKNAESYGDDLNKTVYLYYELWEEVFAEHFKSHITLPNRFSKIPLKNEDKFFKDPGVREEINKIDPALLKRLDDFAKKKGKDGKPKYPPAIYLPPSFPEIPELIKNWVDIRKTVMNNMSPFYLWLSSFNICPVHPKFGILVSDYIH